RRGPARRAGLAPALGAALTLSMFGKRRERDTLVRNFVDSSLVGVARADTDAVVHALALAVFQQTNRGLPLARLPLYDRLEAISFFNVGTGSSLKQGYYGAGGHGVVRPCGTMPRARLHAPRDLGIPA